MPRRKRGAGPGGERHSRPRCPRARGLRGRAQAPAQERGGGGSHPRSSQVCSAQKPPSGGLPRLAELAALGRRPPHLHLSAVTRLPLAAGDGGEESAQLGDGPGVLPGWGWDGGARHRGLHGPWRGEGDRRKPSGRHACLSPRAEPGPSLRANTGGVPQKAAGRPAEAAPRLKRLAHQSQGDGAKGPGAGLVGGSTAGWGQSHCCWAWLTCQDGASFRCLASWRWS